MALKLSALLTMVLAPSTLAEPASLRGSAVVPVANASGSAALDALSSDDVEVYDVEESWDSGDNTSSLEVVAISDAEERENWSSVAVAGEGRPATSVGTCPHSDEVVDPSQSCAASANVGCAGCYLYRACNGPAACVVNGHLVVPGSPMRGMEDISEGNAGSWDFLFDVAKDRCGSESCVLITNPMHYRTLHQLHVRYQNLTDGGVALKGQLEADLCGTSGWQAFSKCGTAKARLYDEMPGVFSAVAEAHGAGSLADVGITVWFTSACGGGLKTVILATMNCSFDHSISSR